MTVTVLNKKVSVVADNARQMEIIKSVLKDYGFNTNGLKEPLIIIDFNTSCIKQVKPSEFLDYSSELRSAVAVENLWSEIDKIVKKVNIPSGYYIKFKERLFHIKRMYNSYTASVRIDNSDIEQIDIENDDPLVQGYIYKIERNGTANKTKFGIMKDVYNNCYILTAISRNGVQSIVRKLPKSLTNM